MSSNTISKEQQYKKKVNNRYNQCVIFAVVACALATPWLISHKSSYKLKQAQPLKLATASPLPISASQDQEKLSKKDIIVADNISEPITLAEPIPAIKTTIEKTVTSVTLKAPAAMVTAPKIINNSKAPVKVPVKTEAKAPVKTPVKAPQKAITVAKVEIKKASNPVVVSISQSKIDTKFIAKVEGVALKGYVPLPKKTKSGVTIAAGFDLGQMNLKEFKSLPMDEALRAKLLPYIGLKKYQATAFLKAHPLHLTNMEVEQLNVIAANKILIPLSTSYYKSSGKSFTTLPAAAQTALFSFAYQYGAGFMKKKNLSQLWNHFVAEDWSQASQALHGFKVYGERRKQEAKLLAHLV